MLVRFWGVRGSIPAPGPETARFGGNTPCVEIRAGDQLIIVDAGTGIRNLGLKLMRESRGVPVQAHLFIGHTHWDHIQGFPFFSPLFLPSTKIKVCGVHGTTKSFLDVISGQMSSTYFPIQLKDLASKPEFVEISEPMMVGPIRVSYHFLNHPGITVGYRFEHDGKTVCYISDHEPYAKLNAKGEFSDKEDLAVAKFIENSDLLICEAQYTADEYKVKRGWGHSTFEDVLDLAVKSGVRGLALFHHDPTHDDDAMDALEAECVKLASQRGAGLKVFAAREGQFVEF